LLNIVSKYYFSQLN